MKTDAFEDDLRQALAQRAAEVPGEAVDRLRNRKYRPRSRSRVLVAGAGVVTGAAVSAAVAVTALLPAGHQPSHRAHAQLTAWTVTKEADGRIFLKIRELRDPVALQRKLRADGVPASVVFHPGPPVEVVRPWRFVHFKNNPCQEYSGGEGQAQNVVRGGSPLTGVFLYPSAIPHGAGVQIVATRKVGGPPFPLFEWLVQASPQCTGS